MAEWTSMEDILDFAIDEEQAAADFYRRLSGQAELPGMREALECFAREELKHKAKLEIIKAGGIIRRASGTVPDLKIGDYLVDVAPGSGLTYQDALVVAMKKEMVAFRLYTDMAESVEDGDLKMVFRALAQEEARHKLHFETEYDELLTDN